MLRFQPDGWIEGLLRPLVMMEPKAGVYFEDMAPDWRFALFLAFLAMAQFTKRLRGGLAFEQRQLILGTFVVLYLWTFAIGNGRYFMTGLLLIGPLLVLSWRLLPGTAPFRWLVLASVAVLQCGVMAQTYMPNNWGLVRWERGDSVDLSDSPIRHQPAVFITSTAISYSILVPKFHPESRWANLVGQSDITPAMREYRPLLQLLSSPLPKFAVMPIPLAHADADLQPTELVRQVYGDLLSPYGLAITEGTCFVLRSSLAPGPPAAATAPRQMRGFWFCPLAYSETSRKATLSAPILTPEVAAAFRMIEQRCPRFFPAGSSNDRKSTDLLVRHYASDVRLLADMQGNVYLKYFRALNPTRIGSLDEVRRGDFQLPCDKLPGRYQAPWQAD